LFTSFFLYILEDKSTRKWKYLGGGEGQRDLLGFGWRGKAKDKSENSLKIGQNDPKRNCEVSPILAGWI
jgi:hypothetical protein